MDKWTSFPAPLKRKMLLTAVVGVGCLLVGIAFTIFAKDTMMLLLSIAVCAFCFYKAFAMFRVASKKDYEIVEGTCTAIVPKLLNKFRKVKITDDVICSVLMYGVFVSKLLCDEVVHVFIIHIIGVFVIVIFIAKKVA